MDAGTLYDAIAEVSPVVSTTIGKPDDRATWKWEPGTNATQAQIDAGNNVVATIPVEIKNTTLPASEFIGRFTNAEYRAATAAAVNRRLAPRDASPATAPPVRAMPRRVRRRQGPRTGFSRATPSRN